MQNNLSSDKPKIMVVGSMNMDLNIYGIQRIANYSESVFAQDYIYSAGGKASNQAYAVQSLGGDSSIVGKIGQDKNGQAILNSLEEIGVRTDNVVRDSDSKTGLATIFVSSTGKYFSYVALGANMKIGINDISPVIDSLQPDLVLCQIEMPLKTVYDLHSETQNRNIPLFIDAGPAQKLDFNKLQKVFIISPNEAETEVLTGIQPTNNEKALAAAKILYKETSAQHVVLKLGKRGALVLNDTGHKFIETFLEVKAVDSTAAGDTFNAAICVQISQGIDIESAIVYANAASSLCVSKKGAMESIPNKKAVDDFCRKNVPDLTFI